MNPTHTTALMRSMSGLASRRGIIGGLASGLLVTGIDSVNVDDAEARKNGKRNKQRNNRNRNKNKNKRDKAKTRLDATCPGAGESGVTHPAGEVRVVQTFTAVRSGAFVKATIPVTSEADTETNLVLQLSPLDGEGAPTNEVLAEASVRIGRAPAAVDVLEFDFADPFSVEAGFDYALVLSRPTGFEFVWRADLGNPCGGRIFVSTDPEEPFQVFSEDADLLFETFVRS